MKLTDIIEKIEQKQKEISVFKKFDDVILKKINYKLRLDWNYHSNRIEGGTLTQEETRSVMIGNIDINGKPFKDVVEMHGHDKLVQEILKLTKGENRISEARIKEMHSAIMFEEDPKEQTKIGKWKTVENFVTNYKDEKYIFTQPLDVSDEIHILINKTNAQLDSFFSSKKNETHPIEIVAQFHLDYIKIHPFYDGNGRTARILMNILLLTFGYPVIIIKDEHKDRYKKLLADIQMYGGNPDLFYIFIGERIHETQALILNALKGEDIDELSDLDKKIQLLDQKLSTIGKDDEVKILFNFLYLQEVLNTWFTDLILGLTAEVQKFEKFFSESSSILSTEIGELEYRSNDVVVKLATFINALEIHKYDFEQSLITCIIFNANFDKFKKGGLNTFGHKYGLKLEFHSIKYIITIDQFDEKGQQTKQIFIENLLHQSLSKSDIKSIIKNLTNTILQHIEFNMQKIGLKE